VREYESYKAVYCGLCRQLGKDYSIFTRLILSYDCTFYAILIMSFGRTCSGFRKGRCTCNPLKKCQFAVCEDDCYSKAAALSVISGYYKLKDDISDSGFFKRTICKFIILFFSNWRKKVLKNYPEFDNIVSQMMKLQYDDEHSENTCIDSAAHPTGFMLGSILQLEAKNDIEKRIYYEFGYQLGRWIYMIDSADDIEKDKKNNNFNSFINCKATAEKITGLLNQSLARAYEAYNLIEITDFKGIIDNIILKGLPLVQNGIISKLITEESYEQSL
jgi:hypothetical protein